MNGEEFYNAFKEALDFFQLSWADKSKMEVTATEHLIIFTYQNKRVGYLTGTRQGDSNEHS